MVIRSIIILGAAFTAMGCATPEATATDCEGTPCAAIGEVFESGGATITALEVLEDSRCPVETECVWAGQVRIRALVERAGRTREVEIATGEPVEIVSGMLTLTQVWPATSVQHLISDPQAYRFSFSWVPHMLDRPN